MVAWSLWISVGWLLTWLVNLSDTSVCGLGVCQCTRGKILCDCSNSQVENITLTSETIENTTSSISIANCRLVQITSKALSGLPALQQVSITNTTNLKLEEHSFYWTTVNPHHNGLLVNITDCEVPEVPSYCFRGCLRDILFTNSNLSQIQAFAFAGINHAEKIEFSRVRIRGIESQAFKKFSVDYFKFSDSDISELPTRAVINVDVNKELVLENIKVDKIATNAFKMNELSHFKISRSTINHIEEQAFHIIMKGSVFIDDNIFSKIDEEAFVEITLDQRFYKEAGKQDFVFENNTLTHFEEEALTFNTSRLNMRLDWIMVNQPCSCAETELLTSTLVFFSPDKSLKFPPSQVSSVVYCLNPKPTSIKDYNSRHCEVSKLSIALKIIIICAVIIAFCATCVIIYVKFKKKGKRYINAPTSSSGLKAADFSKAHMVVVPEGKTYRETELHVIFEHIEPIIQTEYVGGKPDDPGHA